MVPHSKKYSCGLGHPKNYSHWPKELLSALHNGFVPSVDAINANAMTFFRISSISESRKLWPLNSLLAFQQASGVSSVIPPLLASCLVHRAQHIRGALFLLCMEIPAMSHNYGGTGHKFCRFHKRSLPPSNPV